MIFARRPDGVPVKVPYTRRIMPFLLRGRNESVVYFEQRIDVTETLEFLRRFREETGLRATLTHLLIWAVGQVLKARPRLNRFVAGGRLYQRKGIFVSFSAKKAKTDRDPIIVVKQRIDPSWSFQEVVERVEANLTQSRRQNRRIDRELKALLRLPLPLLSLLVCFVRWLDQINLLPAFFYRDDPLYASVFIANLGSINMDAGFHHLYEYGNIPVFITMGRVKKEVVADEHDQPVIKPMLKLCYSFDERIEDGLYCLKGLEILKKILEEPERSF